MNHYMDTNQFVDVFVPNTLDELIGWTQFDKKLHGKDWIYRGQSDFNWNISSTLERNVEGLNNRKKSHHNIYKVERSVICGFESRIPISFETQIEKLAYIQYHGLPTRLIDFTHNIDVALFFALLGNINGNSAIYAMSREYLRIATMFSMSNYERNGKLYLYDLENDSVIDSLLKKPKTERVVYVNPQYKNERIKIQEGCFMFSANLESKFSYCVSRTLGTMVLNTAHPRLIKFLLKPELKIEIQNYLDSKGINQGYIYPTEHIEYKAELESICNCYKN